MKIVLLQDHLRNGGTERQTLFLADYFLRKGHAPALVLFRPNGRLWEEARKRPISITVLQRWDTGLAFYGPGLCQAISRLEPDILLCMGRTANCYAGYLQRRFPQLTIVATVRTGKTLYRLHLWSLKQVRAILVNSSWWKRHLIKAGHPAASLHVVRNSMLLDIDAARRADQRREMRRQAGIGDSTCLFLNVAAFRPGKRQADLLRACALLRENHPDLDWRLWLVGDGQEWRRCERLASTLGLGQRVDFFGYRKDVFPYYAAADVAVSCSQEDSLPNFLIEAQAMGLPLAAISCKGVSECCRAGETGVIVPGGDLAAFAQTLADLAADQRYRLRLGKGAPAFAQERFSAEAQAGRTLAFLEKLL